MLLLNFSEDETGKNAVIAITMIGKFFIAGSFAIIYNYTAELFPTVVRNTALGVGSMCARLSGALTPLIMLMVRANVAIKFPLIYSLAPELLLSLKE